MNIKIGSHCIGDAQPVFIIAEIGINHQGDPTIARDLIKAAVDAGADAVKFQKRAVDKMLTRSMLEASYINPNSFGSTYGEHRRRLELSDTVYEELKQYAEAEGVLFFASAWDKESADVLERLAVPLYKIASADLTNLPLLDYIAQKQVPLLLSTGMSTIDEVDLAVYTIRKHSEDFVLLQCTSAYPVAFNEINLRTIPMFRERYHCLSGYSGHENGINASIGAVALGACVIERHFTLDKNMKGSDHKTSLEPHEFQALVCGIRQMEAALGTPEKHVWPCERRSKEKLAKSIVATCDLKRGTVLLPEMLSIKSPGTGISPMRLPEFLGRIVAYDIAEDTLLQEDALVAPHPTTVTMK